MLGSVCDAVPTLKQHSVNVTCLLEDCRNKCGGFARLSPRLFGHLRSARGHTIYGLVGPRGHRMEIRQQAQINYTNTDRSDHISCIINNI